MTQLDPKMTDRAEAFALWRNAPMPMVTLFKTLDVTNLLRQSRRRGMGFNLLMCWCIGRAAAEREEFYLLPVGEKLVRYDSLALSTVVVTGDRTISTCDIPFSPDLNTFARDYRSLTRRVAETGKANDLSGEHMVIGTSALVECELDGAVNVYAGIYNNPFLIWGKYRKGLLKARLPISLQFHHAQMDGIPAGRFLTGLQEEIKALGRA